MAGNPLQQMIPMVLQQLMQNPQMLQQVMQPGMLMKLATAIPGVMPEPPQTMMPIRGGTDMEVERTIPEAIGAANFDYSNDRPFRIPMQPMTPESVRQMQDQSVSPDDGELDWILETPDENEPIY